MWSTSGLTMQAWVTNDGEFIGIKSTEYGGHPYEQVFRRSVMERTWEVSLAGDKTSPDAEYEQVNNEALNLMLETIWCAYGATERLVTDLIFKGDLV